MGTDEIGEVIERETGLLLSHADKTQVIQYGKNEKLSSHYDCNNDTNDRSGTALVYLTDVDAGGHTCFPHRGFCIMPRKGAGLFFTSLDSNCHCDRRSEHLTTEVRGGAKIV